MRLSKELIKETIRNSVTRLKVCRITFYLNILVWSGQKLFPYICMDSASPENKHCSGVYFSDSKKLAKAHVKSSPIHSSIQ